MFPRTYKNQKNVGFMLNLVKEYLTLIQQNMPSTFSQLTLNNMIGSEILSADAEMSTKKLPLRIREKFFEVRNDRILKLKFSEVQLDMFWISIKKKY